MKKIIPFIICAVIGGASFFALKVPAGDALAIALDTEKAKAACARLIDFAPPAELVVAPVAVDDAP